MSQYAVVAAFGFIIVFSAVEAVVRQVLLVARQRRMCAVRREPRPFKNWSKA